MYRIIGADGKQYGPVSGDGLRVWIAEGRAHAQTLIQTEGASEWKPLSAWPEFAGLAAPPPTTGSPPRFPAAGAHPLRNSSMAVAGFVCSLLGLTCCGPLFSILGLIFSIVGLGEIRRHPTQYTGGSLAVVGIVLAILGLLLGVVFLIFGLASGFFHGMHPHRFNL